MKELISICLSFYLKELISKGIKGITIFQFEEKIICDTDSDKNSSQIMETFSSQNSEIPKRGEILKLFCFYLDCLQRHAFKRCVLLVFGYKLSVDQLNLDK